MKFCLKFYPILFVLFSCSAFGPSTITVKVHYHVESDDTNFADMIYKDSNGNNIVASNQSLPWDHYQDIILSSDDTSAFHAMVNATVESNQSVKVFLEYKYPEDVQYVNADEIVSDFTATCSKNLSFSGAL